jgi:PD-(D/E)XK endonuclease
MSRCQRRRPLPAPRPHHTLGQQFLTDERLRELVTKRRGELAEIAFTLKATSLDFAVSKPYGDSERYDFITDSHEPDRMPILSRVQVKCSTALLNGQYRINAHRRVSGSAIPYKVTEIDFIVAYIIPEDSWFILPLREILGITSLLFRSKQDPRAGLYDQYREAWHLLRERDGVEIV